MTIDKETSKELKELFAKLESDMSAREHDDQRPEPETVHVEVS